MWTAITLSCLLHFTATSPILHYMVVIPADLHYPSSQAACVHINYNAGKLYATLLLERSGGQDVLLRKEITKEKTFECGKFQVVLPANSTEEVARIRLFITGRRIDIHEEKKVLIRRVNSGTFIQTDKPIYKPRQTVKFRIVTLNEDFIPLNDTYPLVFLQDPNNNRIGQWLDVAPQEGIADLYFQLAAEPPLGTYIISVAKEKAHSSFSVEEYVLPKFEVVFEEPTQIYALDKIFPLRVCGRYTYGKGVQGKIQVSLCQTSWWYFYGTHRPPLCQHYNNQTDKMGCFSTSVYLSVFNQISPDYRSNIDAVVTLVEDGTEVQVNASRSFFISRTAGTATFEEVNPYYYTGEIYRGKIKIVDHQGKAVNNAPVYLILSYTRLRFNKTYITDDSGRASFELNTNAWNGDSVSLEGRFLLQDPVYVPGTVNVYYQNAYHFIQPLYTTSKSFLRIVRVPGTVPCGKNERVQVDFRIYEKDLSYGPKSVDFSYYVIGKVGIVLSGQKTFLVGSSKMMTGTFFIPLVFTSDYAPAPTIVVYVIFPTGGIIADSAPFRVSMCFKNEEMGLKIISNTHIKKPRECTTTVAMTTMAVTELESTVPMLTRPTFLTRSVNITLSTEALATKDLCGGEVPFVPERGRTDTLIKPLLVQPEGVLVEKAHSSLLCPKGGDIMGTALQNLDRLVQMPSGCGEQNMVLFAPIIYVLQYLEKTGQLTPEIRERATGFLRSGKYPEPSSTRYQRQLLYKHHDGSYSAFGTIDQEGNTWLTAFVAKCFGQARPYIFLDDRNIRDALSWLQIYQLPSGCFRSVGKLFHTAMKGGVDGEVPLAAYITAAHLEIGEALNSTVVNKALSCLTSALPNITSTYTQALLAYAFALAHDTQRTQELLTKLDQKAIRTGGQIHWSQAPSQPPSAGVWSQPQSVDVELTSYVLLALLCKLNVTGADIAIASGIVAWLTKQQNAYGGFASTQDTVVALQALAKYGALTYNEKGDVEVIVKSQGSFERKFQVTHKNRLLLQQAVLTEIPGEFSVQAQGSGCIYAQTVLRYNEPPPQVSVTFSVRITTQLIDCTKGDMRIVTIRIHVSYIGSRVTSNMVIVEVSLLSGFSLASGSRTSLQSSPLVRKTEVSQSGVSIYLDQLSNTTQTYALQLEQEIEVINLKPGHIRVYDYYQPEEQALANYSAICS
ncbi:hypothetical protein KIL84_020157 [Mauremys mutica]|uniref:Alpha-2-macroglobulin-like protein 1 n=1 Tax=Mauremys mutica TaxID=74926 RepID=A0A9D4BAP3_9SAUR|nr:hypothetical protein KIL84_020157 [Mauremys mutica]